jgi:hypothetical protein
MPPQANAEVVCAMEEVLIVYHQPYSAVYPLVCLDASNKHHLKERGQPLPMEAGQPQRYDYTL